MDQKVTQILLFFGLCIPSSYHIRHFHYVNVPMNWTNAQNYCREKYTDLATIESMDDINRLNRPPLDTIMVWIGLRDDPNSWKGKLKTDSNSWRFSATGQPSQTGYEVWAPGEPNSNGVAEFCVAMAPDGGWYDSNCAYMTNSVCYNGTAGNKTYVSNPLSLSWRNAQAYCRTHYTDLATIESSEELTKVYQVKPLSTWGWIGLYRTPWAWSDNSNSLFRNWFNGEPNNGVLNEFCVSENLDHKWFDSDCTIKNAFICHEDLPKVYKTVVKMKLQTDTDLTDAAINTQILQQLSAAVANQRPADIKLQWKTEPKK